MSINSDVISGKRAPTYTKKGKKEKAQTEATLAGLRNAPNTSTNAGPVYTPPPVMNAPNTSTNAGPVYTPPPGANTSTNNGPVYNLPPVAPMGQVPLQSPPPGAPSSSPLPAQPQGTQAPQQFQDISGLPSGVDAQGNIIGSAAPVTADDILFLQGFTGLGKAFLEKVGSMVATDSASLATKFSLEAIGKKGSLRALTNMEQKGKMALTPEGAKLLSQSIDEASGLVKKVPLKPGEIPWNSKTLYQKSVYIKQVATPYVYATAIIGGIFGSITAKQKTSSAGRTAVSDDLTAFSSSFVKDGQTLRDAGYGREADGITACAQEVSDALESGAFDSFINGKEQGTKALNECKQLLSDGLAKVERDKSAKAKQEVFLQEQAALLAANQAEADKQAQRDFQQQQQDDQQAFQTSEREARQTYEQQQNDAAAAQRQFEEDTATTNADGSTLTFGLLGTSGATEFVDRDKASKVYFGKVYEELTPEQQRLLNLLKGKH